MSTPIKKFIEESSISTFLHGNYPTSDKTDTIAKSSPLQEWGCHLELSDGCHVTVSLTQMAPDVIYVAFTSNGDLAKVWKYEGKIENLFTGMKKEIEDFYDKKFLDEDRAKTRMDLYLEKTFGI